MAQYVAAALAGVEADDADEAFDIAQHNVCDWEVTGVTPAEDISIVLGPVTEVVSATDPRKEPLIPLGERPLFGKAALLWVPMVAWGAIADTSGLRAAAGAFAAVLG